MRKILAFIFGPIVGIISYSIAVILRSIIQGEFEPTIPGIGLFIFGNVVAFAIMAIFTNWLSPERNGAYILSSILYTGFTIIGMVTMGSYPFYYYIIIGLLGIGALGYSLKK